MINRIGRIFIVSALLLVSLQVSYCFAEDTWISEFEDICGRTEDSSGMNKEELKALIDRCDKLRPVIESSDNPQKKIYLFRLDKCKNLFNYAIQVGEKNK